MKLLKTNMVAMLALMLGISAAQASPTVIRLIGSTAYRGDVENAITHTLASGFTFAWYTDPNTGFSSIDKAQAVIYSGTIAVSNSGNDVVGGTFLTAGTPVIIKAYWGGSVGGAKALVKLETPTSDSANWWLSETGNTLTTAGTRLTSPVYNDTTVSPDAAFSDAAPSTIQAYLAAQNVAWSDTGYSEALVGVNTFVFVKGILSSGTTMSGSFTNITSQQFRAAETTMPLSIITGSAADSNITVAPMGRDEDSGTRITALAETGLGTITLLQQIQPISYNTSSSHITGISIQNAGTGYTSTPTVTITNAPADTSGSNATATAAFSGGVVSTINITNAGTGYTLPPTVAISGGGGAGATANASIGGSIITDDQIWPSATVAQVTYPTGDSGFTNGPDLAYALNQTPNSSGDTTLGIFPAIFTGYLSVGDAAGVNSGSNALTYNGAACTALNIENGQYSFWSYEHMYWKTTNANASYMKGIAQQLYAKESLAGTVLVNGVSVNKTLRIQDMQVSRGVEGSVITSNGGSAAPTNVTIQNH